MTEKQIIHDDTVLSDNELISLIRNGDEKAFNLLIIRHRSTVSILAKKYFSSSLTDDDWLQEGMIGLIYAVRTFNSEKNVSFPTYACVCIKNRLNSALKKANNSGNTPLNSSLAYNDDIVPATVSTEDDYINNENNHFLTTSFIKKLSKTEQDVIRCYLSGFSYCETAKKLGITEKSVDNALCRAKSKLKKSFDM